MGQATFQQLLDKYLSGTLSDTELKEFNVMLDDPAYLSQLEKIIDSELENHAYASQPDERLQGIIQDNLKAQINSAGKVKSISPWYRLRWVAAAVLLFFVSASVYWLLQPKQEHKQVMARTSVHDSLAPGGNKAVLQLADGSTIVLDSVHNGTLATQGKVNVVQLADGKLAYENAGETTAVAYNIISTPRGGQYQLQLADGTKVWLNASSSLKYPVSFSGKERRVALSGEGYFEVAKNADMPFHVDINGVDVAVKGTHFNINGYNDEAALRTTLLEGSVVVSNSAGNCLLKPGQQAAIKDNAKPEVTSEVDIEEVMAWKNGRFHFKSADLDMILRQAARWYDIDFVKNGKVNEKFSGEISRNVNAEQLLHILEATDLVQFQVKGKTVIVSPK